MKRIGVFGALALLIGCGEGPRHIPKADYQHGKAAFELLEQYEKTSDYSFEHVAEQQIVALDTKHWNNGLYSALTEYEVALGDQRITQLRPYDVLAAHYIAPIVKLCHDDAAQYFDANAASTNTCQSALAAFRTKYPSD